MIEVSFVLLSITSIKFKGVRLLYKDFWRLVVYLCVCVFLCVWFFVCAIQKNADCQEVYTSF